MARLKRQSATASAASSQRLRAAWLYYHQNLTQREIADRLGTSRATVVRMLEDARRRSEVRIRVAEGVVECLDLAVRLEAQLDINEVIVVPGGGDPASSAQTVGAGLGRFLSDIDLRGLRIGVGWGRTLSASLKNFDPSRSDGAEIISLLGGVVQPGLDSPIEFTWRLAGRLDAQCYPLPAPLLVDSAQTRQRLIEACGLGRIFEMASALDLAIVSVGDIGTQPGPPLVSSLSANLLSPSELAELNALGCVADVLCTFLARDGREVDHPVHQRVVSVGLDRVATAGHIILASGGAHRAEAIVAARKRLPIHTLITDESAATALLSARDK
jgi:DNA-binding transcriptional regulator LsrR (DeoR family)